MTLEEQIREAVKYGITHLTLAPTWSSDGKTTYWRASATPSTMHKYVTCSSTDPIEALIGVLKAMPKAPARREPKVTATVTLRDPPRIENYKLDDPIPHPDAPTRFDNITPLPLPEPQEDIDQWLPKT